MSTEAKQPEVVAKSTEEQLIERGQNFWSKYSKLIVGAIAALVLVVGGYFAYTNFVQKPAIEKANEAIWRSQINFKSDSFNLALKGNPAQKGDVGFLKVIKDHSGTPAGNLAKYYAGICYLHLGDFNNAVKYLEEYKAGDAQLKLMSSGSLGDAYAELGKVDKAYESYKVATTAFVSDDFNTAEFLYRLAQLYDKNGKTKEAIEAFTRLKNEFPTSNRSFEADKYLGKLGETK
jgi:tetratricopeptide (TPR) repeat protein